MPICTMRGLSFVLVKEVLEVSILFERPAAWPPLQAEHLHVARVLIDEARHKLPIHLNSRRMNMCGLAAIDRHLAMDSPID